MARGTVTLPYWMVYDDSGDDGGVPPVKATNVSMVEPEKYVTAGLWHTADTLEELAATIGVPPQNLVETVTRFNEFVRRGVDDDFGRGDEAYDRAFSGGAPPLYRSNGRRSTRPRSASPIWAPRAACAPIPPRGCSTAPTM